MTDIPKRLEHDSIIDAIIEIRFETDLNPNVVFAEIYSNIKEKFGGQVQSLPISQMPPDLIRQDPNLKNKPLYRINGDDCSLQIGSQMIALSSKMPYIGWEKFSEMFSWILSQCYDHVSAVTRLGLRYINFFEGDISDRVNIEFKLMDGYEMSKLNIQTEVITEEFANTIQYSPNAIKQTENGTEQGSAIDIDTFKMFNQAPCSLSDLLDDVNKAHQHEKEVFFSLLKPELIEQMCPEY